MVEPDSFSAPWPGEAPSGQQGSGPRRDCPAHRGNWLEVLAAVAFACGACSFLLILPAALGIPLALITSHLARRDLGRMDDGSLDSRGYDQTFKALCLAESSVRLNAVGLVACSLISILACFVVGVIAFALRSSPAPAH
jgi:hypothetical protein